MMKYLQTLTKPHRQTGFTIVELMVATLVFSVVLLVITFGVVHFTNSYYQGVNSSTTQTAAQNAIDTISQAVQFNSSTPVSTDETAGVFCAGDKKFLYTLGKKFTGTAEDSNRGLYVVSATGSGCADQSPKPATDNGTELLGKNMRVVTITVVPDSSVATVWNISLKIAYGDDDLLCSPSVGGSCNSSHLLSAAQLSNSDLRCKIQTGFQFCSVATLSTIAEQRLQ